MFALIASTVSAQTYVQIGATTTIDNPSIGYDIEVQYQLDRSVLGLLYAYNNGANNEQFHMFAPNVSLELLNNEHFNIVPNLFIGYIMFDKNYYTGLRLKSNQFTAGAGLSFRVAIDEQLSFMTGFRYFEGFPQVTTSIRIKVFKPKGKPRFF